MTFAKSTISAFLLVFNLGAIGLTALPEGARADRGLIEVGSGFETGTGQDKLNLLLKVAFTGEEETIHYERYFKVKVNANLAVDTSGGTGGGLPYFEASFVPAGVDVFGSGDLGVTMNYAPIRLSRDVRLNQNLVAQVEVIGVDAHLPLYGLSSDQFLVSLHLALDAMGAKLLVYGNDQDVAGGWTIARPAAEVSARLGQRLGFNVTFTVGSSTDLNFVAGGGAGSGAHFQSDTEVHAQLQADFHNFLTLFFRASTHVSILVGSPETPSVEQLMAGLIVKF